MARINLLPWREELRKQYLNDFLKSIAIFVVFTLVVLLGVHMVIEGMKDYQNRRNKMLDKEIARLNITIKEIKDIESKKNKMLGKIDVIHKLQLSRPQIVHLFEDIAKTLPEGVYLNNVKQVKQALTMEGLSQSNARVSAYMRAIDASQWLKSPQLKVIKAGAGKGGHSDKFTMRAQQSRPKKKQVTPQVNKGRR